MTDREKEWAAYRAWKEDFRGPIYFQHWDQWIAEYGFACWQASRRAALEESAKACDEIASDCWSLYKGRAPYTGREAGRADPGVQGESDGADKCAVAIRKLATETNNG